MNSRKFRVEWRVRTSVNLSPHLPTFSKEEEILTVLLLGTAGRCWLSPSPCPFVVLLVDEAIPPLLLLCTVSKRKHPHYEVLWRVTMGEAEQHLLVLRAESLLWFPSSSKLPSTSSACQSGWLCSQLSISWAGEVHEFGLWRQLLPEPAHCQDTVNKLGFSFTFLLRCNYLDWLWHFVPCFSFMKSICWYLLT